MGKFGGGRTGLDTSSLRYLYTQVETGERPQEPSASERSSSEPRRGPVLSPRDSAWGGRGEEVGLAGEPCGGRSARPVVPSQGQGRLEGSVPFDLTIELVIFTVLVLSNHRTVIMGKKKKSPHFFT